MDDCGMGRKGNLREMVLGGKFLPVLLNKLNVHAIIYTNQDVCY